ncbi:MAG: BspA family leucine-rich repeat surface protein [Eubacterium sp.]|nr:BspA family leucine-rich repeat surface protein [Eubacterium sp.]
MEIMINRNSRCTKMNKGMGRKGFTMVELIVVLVILAILAAVVVPLMFGFTDSAKEKKYTEEAKRALTAAESMLSTAYTENLMYVPARLREQAELDANLPDTGLTVYTKESFRVADGTSKTLACYTIVEAVYKTDDGHYLYYDGSEWTVKDSQPASADIKNSDNDIIVWPRGQYLTDSAGNASDTTAQGGNDPSEPITEDDDTKTHDYSADNPDEPEPDMPDDSFKSAYIKLVSDDHSVSFGGSPTFETIYTEDNGFAENPTYTLNTMLYDDSKMTWQKGEDIPCTSQSDFADRVKELVEQLAPPEGDDRPTTTFTFHVSADEKTISIPITFEAYNKKTLSVSVIGGDDNTNTATVKYGMVSGLDISQLPVVSVSGNDNTKFSGTWYGKANGVDISGAEAKDANFATEVKNVVDSWMNAKVQEAENSTGTLDVVAIEAQGVSFVAPADVYKTLYVKETDGAGNTGLIKFGSGAGTTTQLVKKYAKNEKTKELFTVNGSGEKSASAVDENTYSIFTENPIYVGNVPFASAKKKLKFWHVFESNNTGGELVEDLSRRNRQKDCSSILLGKLYDPTYEKYGEVAEIELTDLSTRLIYSDNSPTPLKSTFETLVGGAGNINAIEFCLNPDEPTRYASRDKEVCISTTTIKAGSTSGMLKLNDDGKYDVATYDTNYPAYTVAYRVKDSNGKYTIYVLVEDGSEMKAQGSYAHLHDGFNSMSENTFVSHLDTAAVNDMQYMFNKCGALTGLNLDNFEYTEVQSTAYMFAECEQLTSITMSGPAPKLTTMERMFSQCKEIQTINMGTFDTSGANGSASMLTSTKRFLDGAIKLENLDIRKLDTRSVTNMESMFRSCDVLESITWDDGIYPLHIDSATDINSLFYKCHAIKGVRLVGSNVDSKAATAIETPATNPKIDNGTGIFKQCYALQTVRFEDIKFTALTGFGNFFSEVKSGITTVVFDNVVAPAVTSFYSLFGNDKVDSACTNLTTVTFDGCGFAGVTTMEKMFRNCTSLQVSGIDFTDTNFGSLNNTKYMFAGCTGFVGAIDLDSTQLDLSNVTNMQYMFEGCTELTSVTVFPSCSSGVNCDYMFHNCDALVVVDSFNIQYASSIKGLFQSCDQLTSVTLTGSNSDSGDASAIDTSLTQVADAFKEDSSLDTINIENLRFSELTSMGAFFTDVKSSLTTVSITNVAAPQMTSFSRLFQGCSLLSSLTFDWRGLSTISDMSYMFSGCGVLDFEQVVDIVPSNPSGVNCKYMFENCDSFTDVQSFNIRYASDISYLFNKCDGLVSVSLVGDGMDQGALLETNQDKAAGIFNSCNTFSSLTISDLYFEKYQNGGEIPGNVGDKDKAFSLQRILRWAPAENIVLRNIAFPVTFGSSYQMFYQNKVVKSIVLENLKLPGLGRMKQMFSECSNVETITFKKFDAPNAWNYGIMFRDCQKLKKVDFGNVNEEGEIHTFNTNHNSDFEDMFKNCYSLQTIKGLEKFNTSSGVAFTNMFYDCRSLEVLDLSGFVIDPSKLTTVSKLENMFGTTAESQLTTIYASEDFVLTSKLEEKNMFGAGLIHLCGANGTAINNASSPNKKYTGYYAWIDGRTTDGRADSQGYFTNSSLSKAKLRVTNGNWVSAGLPSGMSGTITAFGRNDTYKTEQELLAYFDANPEVTHFECHDSNYNNINVYFWIDSDNKLNWWSVARTVYINDNTINMFQNWTNLVSADLKYFDTTCMSSMSQMFSGCTSLQRANISSFNYDNISSISKMFYNCGALSSDDVQGVRTARLAGVNCSEAFSGCEAFTTIKAFDITYANDISGLFKNCSNLTNVTLTGSGYKESSEKCELANDVNKNKEVFKDAGTEGFSLTIKNIYFKNYKSNKGQVATDKALYNHGLYTLIHSAENATNIELNGVTMPNVYTMEFMFGTYTNKEEIKDVGSVRDFPKLENVKLININAPIQRMKSMFKLAENLKTVVFKNFDTSWGWNFSVMFQGCYSLTSVEFGKGFTTFGSNVQNPESWDFHTDFNRMFDSCCSLTSIKGIERFNTSNAKTMTFMFNNCYSLKELDLSSFDTTGMTHKFKITYNGSKWETPFYHMFWTESVPEQYSKESSELKTIYASEDFTVPSNYIDDKNKSVVINPNTIPMFGEKLTNLTGGSANATTMNSVDSSKKNTAYYAWIDGRSTDTRSDTQGYFTMKTK